MPYRLAAIDLDGTLLHPQTHSITPGNAAAITRARQRGLQIVLASGRAHETIAAFAAELRFAPETPIISFNGAKIRTLDGDTTFHRPVPAQAAAEITQFCADQGHHLNYYLDDRLYVRERTHWADVYHQRTGTVPHVVNDLGEFAGRQPTKLLLIDTKDVTDRLLKEFRGRYGDSLYLTKTEDEYLEFMDPRVSKGDALARVAAALGVVQADCVAFGDSYNDVSMLQWAGLGIAMASGREEAKQAADRIAPPAEDDGVGQILEEMTGP